MNENIDADYKFLHYFDEDIGTHCACRSNSKIEEEEEKDDGVYSKELFEMNLKKEPLDTIREEDCESSVFSIDIHNDRLYDVVYVAVGETDSSMEALSWTLKHLVNPNSTIVSLVHVFPQAKRIPTSLGKIPRRYVSQEQVNNYLSQEKRKRRILLQKFIDMCTGSKVKVEMLLIEGDNVGKAIVDLVKNLNIRKLVIGITQSNLRKHESRRHDSTAEMVLKSVEERCDIKIICEGREVNDLMINGYTLEHDGVDDLVPIKQPKPFWLSD
ncbi:U-box domain-containing protein 35-like [Vicia villosa]|uniref:U-box domain-containing protein 35-like n=1 Tax=Vicia villosa TaxID=3911 RepID=UPI00273ABE4F|nr:U-box domain-containing protein 35-like [Vicia villosa]